MRPEVLSVLDAIAQDRNVAPAYRNAVAEARAALLAEPADMAGEEVRAEAALARQDADEARAVARSAEHARWIRRVAGVSETERHAVRAGWMEG